MLHYQAMHSFFRRSRVYLDHAAAMPVLPQALSAMRQIEGLVGNPGALHAEGVAAKESLHASRAQLAQLFGVKALEIIFTPSLTASNNLAILGFARTLSSLTNTHWIVSAIEHSSVLSCFKELERLGAQVSYARPDARGVVAPSAIAALLRPETVFVSVGWANNEIGVVQPLADIAATLRAHESKHASRILLHADAGQAPLYESTLIHSLGVDLLSLGSNKLGGPHGIGALYRARGVSLSPILFGGAQEGGAWAGTEHVALAAGFAAALAHVAEHRHREGKRVRMVRDELAKQLVAHISDVIVNGNPSLALPHLLNISVPRISAEYLVLALDHAGFAVSGKSACREGEDRESHVVAALSGANDAWRASHAIRFSLGANTTSAQIQRLIRAVDLICTSR